MVPGLSGAHAEFNEVNWKYSSTANITCLRCEGTQNPCCRHNASFTYQTQHNSNLSEHKEDGDKRPQSPMKPRSTRRRRHVRLCLPHGTLHCSLHNLFNFLYRHSRLNAHCGKTANGRVLLRLVGLRVHCPVCKIEGLGENGQYEPEAGCQTHHQSPAGSPPTDFARDRARNVCP